MFDVGEKVEFVKYPSLRGVVREILPAEDDLPETVSVDMFIPAGEQGFQFTGITENFWCAPEDLRGLTMRPPDPPSALVIVANSENSAGR